MWSGNLSITQGVKTMLGRAIKDSALDPDVETILNCPTMHRVAEIVGDAMCSMRGQYRNTIEMQESAADAAILIAGQRKAGKPRLYLVSSAGNFIDMKSTRLRSRHKCALRMPYVISKKKKKE